MGRHDSSSECDGAISVAKPERCDIRLRSTVHVLVRRVKIPFLAYQVSGELSSIAQNELPARVMSVAI